MTTVTQVLQDVAAELERANAKHGDPERPMICYLPQGNRTDAQIAQEMAVSYGIPPAWKAKYLCEARRDAGTLTHFDIMLEEVCESLEAATIGTPDELYAELIQVAAMATKMARQVKR